MEQATASYETRHRLLDGIRGVAILLVVLSHGWALWPMEQILDNRWVEPLFTSGNFAVSIFFVVGAFLATRAMLRRADEGAELHVGVTALRRYIRLSGQLLVMLLVVLIVTATDDASSYPDNDTGASALRIATYTWNWYLVSEPFAARPDLGHLWYLSVDLQVFLLVLGLVYVLGRRRGWLLATLGVLAVASCVWRSHVLETDGAYQALLQTSTRMDAPLAGALAAVALPYVASRGGLRRWARSALVVSVLALIPVLFLTDDEASFSGWQGALLDLTLLVFVMACALTPSPRVLERTLGTGFLVFLGRRSLSLYLWHYPLFWFVSRHTDSWAWETRTLVALVATFVVAELSERVVETRVQSFLRSDRWHELDAGIPNFVSDRVRRWWQSPEDDGDPAQPSETDRSAG